MGLLTYDDGMVARTPEDAANAQAADYIRCYTDKSAQGAFRGQPCPFHLSPAAQTHVTEHMGGYFTCPSCKQSHDLLHEMPWHGVPEEEYNPQAQQEFHSGGGTRIGMPMTDQGEVGEALVKSLGEIPGYGPITWWHEGGAAGQSPLDGATDAWGIEVKTLGYDAMHHRYVPGGERKRADGTVLDEKLEKNQMALKMNKQGILGVLVLLDYRRSVADIYVQEHPIEVDPEGNITRGTKTFRSHQATHLVKEIPFRNPLLDPNHPAPVSNQAGQNLATDGTEMAF